MDNDLSKALTTAGFSKNETLVYISLLKSGESKVSEIIKDTQFRSGKIYEVLDSLLKKGVIAETIKNNVKHYSPMPPERIVDHIHAKKIELEDQEANLKSLLPKLAMFQPAEKTLIRVFEGIEGIKTATIYQHENASPGSQVLSYGVSGKRPQSINLMWARCADIIQKRKLKTRLIITDSSKESMAIVDHLAKIANYDIRFDTGSSDSNFGISDDMIILYHYEKENCVLIEDKDYVQTFKEIFDKLWAHASTHKP